MPDEFHHYQPHLLRETFQPPGIPDSERFVGTDINLYYDPTHTLRYKKPDLFAVIGVPKFYDHRVLRYSYVVWDEGVSPYFVIELLSPGTEEEDLGLRTHTDASRPPGKWEVYEQILEIPYYALYDRRDYRFRFFKLVHGRYLEQDTERQPVWLPEIELGLGQWRGDFEGHADHWLRWFTVDGRPVPTKDELHAQTRLKVDAASRQVEQERQRTEQERQRTEQERQRARAAERRVAELEALLERQKEDR